MNIRSRDELIGHRHSEAKQFARSAREAGLLGEELTAFRNAIEEAGNLADILVYLKRRYVRVAAWRNVHVDGKTLVDGLEELRTELLATELSFPQRKQVIATYIGMIDSYYAEGDLNGEQQQ